MEIVADLQTPHRLQCMLLSAPKPAHPLSLVFVHTPCALLHTLAHVSRCFCAAAQLVLYHILEHSATAPAKADACVASLAATSHLTELVTLLTILMYPFMHGTPFCLVLHLVLMCSPCLILTFSQGYCLPLCASCRLQTHPLHVLQPVPCGLPTDHPYHPP